MYIHLDIYATQHHDHLHVAISLRMRLVQRIHPLLIPLLFLLILTRLLLSLSQQPPLDPPFFPFTISIPQDLSVWDQEDGEFDEFFADVYEAISVGRGHESAGWGEAFPSEWEGGLRKVRNKEGLKRASE